jgi:type VI secretion system protein ImpL
MLKLLTSRIVLVVLGLIALAIVVWVGGPYIQFGESYRPLDSVTERLVAMALLVAGWLASVFVRRRRAKRAGDKLVAAVVEQSQAEQPNPEAARLREQFEQAVASLKQKRRGGHSLYDLPWYVFIGAPGSGKTTALVNSGLNFPLEQRSGKGALRGVGGTRNCDWWFTDEAIFLDTAGRYTTQDSDAASDSAGWIEFLALLRKYRKRRPVNGIILTVSAQDLMLQGQREREAYVAAARRRLDELYRELKIQIPVYLMVTKCDLVAGFSEYFDDLAQDGRAQVWGVTFPYEQTLNGRTPDALPAEFDALIARLNERVFARLDQERDARRRAKMFGFPQQMAALRDTLVDFASETFATTRFDRQVLLRGVYFTSGTQEGNPIDRLLGALGRRFAIAPDAVAAPAGRGKAYFIERLLKDVLLAESGLAGVNRRFEFQKAAAQLGAYAAMIALAILAVVLFAVSYSRNTTYIEEVAAEVTQLEQVPALGRDASLERLLPRLDAVRYVSESANRYRDGAPWSMRAGLFQGESLGESARAAYGRELRGALLSQVAARIERRLVQYAPEPEKLFEYLKAYLMLGDPARLDKDQLAYIGDVEWSAAYADDPDAARSVATHFRSLLENSEALRPITLDDALVKQARSSIRQASVAGLMYRQLRLSYAGDQTRELRIDLAAGVGADRVLRRKSGLPLSQPVRSMYTAAVFKELTSRGTDEIVRRFTADAWVWGPDGPPETNRTTLLRDVNDAYERDYISVWDRLLNDIDHVPLSTLASTKEALAILAGPTSPLRGFLRIVDEQTYIVPPAEPAKAPTGLRGTLEGIFESGREGAGVAPATPGAQITAHFARIHQLVSGDVGSAPIDQLLQKLRDVQQRLDPIGPDVGGENPAAAATVRGLGDVVNSIRRDAAALPPEAGAITAVVTQVADRALGVVRDAGRGTLTSSYDQDVLRECREVVSNRYPFVAGSATDVPLADFGRLFGYGGVYDTFFKNRLEELVDTTRPTWAWRSDASGAAVGGTVAMLRQFEAAHRIRRMFFRLGSTTPEVPFTATPLELDQAASRFVLEIDGQRLEDRHIAPRSIAARWPGPNPNEAAATFETNAGTRPPTVTRGPWAWFRLMETAELQREPGDTKFQLTFRKDGLSAVVGIEAQSVNNPFGSLELLRGFTCG